MCERPHGSAYVITGRKPIHTLPDMFIINETEVRGLLSISIMFPLSLHNHPSHSFITVMFVVVLIWFSFFFFFFNICLALLSSLSYNRSRRRGQFSVSQWCSIKQSPCQYMFTPQTKTASQPLMLCFPVSSAICLSLSPSHCVPSQDHLAC